MKTNRWQIDKKFKKQVLLLLTMSFFLALVARGWHSTWDDSGITLAFSKNFARYGDIFATPLSNRVEGYSSFLWMMLNSFYFRLGLQEDVVVTLAKTTSTGLALINIFFFWKLISANLRTHIYQFFALALFAINSYTIGAAIDGMETSLYAFLVLVAYFLYQKRTKSKVIYLLFALFSAMLILIRHEGVLFLMPFVVETLIRRRKDFLKEPYLYFWAIVFLAYHFWHYTFFGEWLTNPMLAKRHWPYRPEFQGWASFATFYLYPFFDFFNRYIFIFICLPIYYFVRKQPKTVNKSHENWMLIYLIGLTSLFIMLITGANWGAALRLSYPGLAFLLLLLFSKIDDPELLKQSKILQIGAAFGLMINFVIVFGSLRELTPDLITLAGVERRASVLAAAKNAIGHREITFAGVDMGGLLLYHGDGLKVVDLGLLCDKELAKNGYIHYEKYVFEQSKPEIIEAHGFFLQPLRKAASFTSLYSPIIVLTQRDKQIFYIRKDIVAELKNKYAMPDLTINAAMTDDTEQQQTLSAFDHYNTLDLSTTEQK